MRQVAVSRALCGSALPEAAIWARQWLFEQALPLWWQVGADHKGGGFHEQLDVQGRPVGQPTRVRVQARQVYVYAEVGRLGWPGPWREAMGHGLDFLLKHYPRDDGLFRSRVKDDEHVDLYDQAFVLFALAHAYRTRGGEPSLLAVARRLLDSLDKLLGHSLGGYEEASPRVLPLRSNPHMHLLEALLAWVEAGVSDPFAARARGLAELALARMVDPVHGAIGEYFDGDWRPAAGEEGGIREPGHQFEWAYLLDLCDRLLGTCYSPTGCRLERFGSQYGIDPQRRVVVFALDAAGCVRDARARLWAQTERLRAVLVLSDKAESADRKRLLGEAEEAVAVLKQFLATPTPGLWWEWMDAEGRLLPDPSPASSLYHLVSALSELCRRGTSGS